MRNITRHKSKASLIDPKTMSIYAGFPSDPITLCKLYEWLPRNHQYNLVTMVLCMSKTHYIPREIWNIILHLLIEPREVDDKPASILRWIDEVVQKPSTMNPLILVDSSKKRSAGLIPKGLNILYCLYNVKYGQYVKCTDMDVILGYSKKVKVELSGSVIFADQFHTIKVNQVTNTPGKLRSYTLGYYTDFRNFPMSQVSSIGPSRPMKIGDEFAFISSKPMEIEDEDESVFIVGAYLNSNLRENLIKATSFTFKNCGYDRGIIVVF